MWNYVDLHDRLSCVLSYLLSFILTRVWSKLILKGHELRKRCGKVLRSTDYSILTENKSICDSMDELLELIASCELAPCPSYELTWVCENELTDAIKYHGLIVEENGKALKY